MSEPNISILALHLLSGVGAMTYRRLLSRFGSPEGILNAPEKHLFSVPGVRRSRLNTIVKMRSESMKKAEEEIREAARLGVDIFDFTQGGYPAALKSIFDPPLIIYVWGEVRREDALSVAIVGTRRPSLYGEQAAERFALELAGKGFTVISGLARGVDTSAHQGTLKAGGRTIGVMGSGLNHPYPPENEPLMEQIAANGAVVSELPFGAPPSRETFPRRNRLISGLSLGTIVVEGKENSGALITARSAVEQGREVFAVPGRVDDPRSRGPHLLIKQGAKLVERADDVLNELGPVADFLVPPKDKERTGPSVEEDPPPASSAKKPADKHPGSISHRKKQTAGEGEKTAIKSPSGSAPLPAAEGKILDILSSRPVSIDDIIAESGLSPQEVSSHLLVLEIKRLVRHMPGNMYARAGND